MYFICWQMQKQVCSRPGNGSWRQSCGLLVLCVTPVPFILDWLNQHAHQPVLAGSRELRAELLIQLLSHVRCHANVEGRHAMLYLRCYLMERASFKGMLGWTKGNSCPHTVSSPAEDAKTIDKIKFEGMIWSLWGYGEGKRVAGEDLQS